MRLASFRASGVVRTGGLITVDGDDYLADLSGTPGVVPADMTALLEAGPPRLATAAATMARVAELALDPEARQALERAGALHRLDGVQLLPPVPKPSKIISVGINYPAHVAEAAKTGFQAPDYPVAFSKLPSTLIGHGEAIVHPATTTQLDYEGELCMVIGRRCRDVPLDQALDVVAGYTIMNDVSLRDVQFAEMRRGILMEGKNLDTTGPLGPFLVTADEVGDPQDLWLTTRVNGEERQHDHTANMVFSCAEQIAYWSRITLEPGDIITTGTPAGVAVFRDEPERYFLAPGDVVEVEIDRVGLLRNPVVDFSERRPL